MERGGSSNSRPTPRVPRSGAGQQGSNRDTNHHMPITSLMRIMHHVLPANAIVADDAKEAIQECVSEFISFITREANERCHRECRRTITPDDVVSTMSALGFHNYVDPLNVFLEKHRAQEHNYYPPSVAARQPSVVPPPPPPPMVSGYVPLPPPPPPPIVDCYVPSPPVHTTDDGDYVPKLPQERDYFKDCRGGGEGSASGDMDFDPFD